MDLKLFQELLPVESEYLLDLHTAASIGCEERVTDIMENTENKLVIDQQNSCGWTPLMYAACCANLRIVGLLLEEGAYTNLKNHEGHTALILASKCGSTDAVSLLIDHGSIINHCDNKGWSALSYAAAFGHRSVVQLLIEKGAIADHVDKKDGLTPLMLSSAAGHEMVVQDLLQLGLNPNSQSKSGETARSLAVKNGHMKVKNLVDAHLCAKRNLGHQQGMKSPMYSSETDLQKLLNELKLSKYYYIFENHGIDIDMFWLLTEEDLKEIGIQLVGPRKKLCMVIAEWYRNNVSKGNFDDRTFSYKLVLENKRLQHQKEELESALARESDLRKAADYNLNEGIKTLKNFSDTVQRTLSYTTILEEKLKQHYVNFKKLLYHAPDASWMNKADIIYPLMGEMEKLLDSIHHHTVLALQQTNFRR